LAEIEARCNAATPGPWDRLEAGSIGMALVLLDMSLRQIVRPTEADLDFIASARADVPDLLAEVKRLRAEMAVCLSTKGGGWACAAS